MKKLSLIILFGLSLTLPAIAQQQITLDLQRTITMGKRQFAGSFPYQKYVSVRLLGVPHL